MASAERAYLPLLDPLRILASVAVVRHHMRRDFLFGVGFGLPLFLVILFALAASSAKEEPFLAFARRKARYLMAPWVRWSLIYVAILIAHDAWSGLPPLGHLEPAMLLEGGNPMLWFLPFAAVALVALKALRCALPRVGGAPAVLGWAVLAVLATNAVAFALTGHPPLHAWLRVSPAAFWGLALGASLGVTSDAERRRLLFVVALLAVLAGWLAPLRDHVEDLPRRFAVAVPLACAGLAWRVPIPRAVRFVAGLTFGVYVVHPLVAKVLVHVFDVFAWPAALHAGVVWTLAALLVLAIRRSPLPWHECDAPARRGLDGGVGPRPAPRTEPAPVR